MEVFWKVLTKTDVHHAKFSFPTQSLQHLDFGNNSYVDLNIKDSNGELRVIRCWKRGGEYRKPVLTTGWGQFVEDYELRVGDMVVLLQEDDHHIGSQYTIEAKRKLQLFGEEVWGDVHRAP